MGSIPAGSFSDAGPAYDTISKLRYEAATTRFTITVTALECYRELPCGLASLRAFDNRAIGPGSGHGMNEAFVHFDRSAP